jgi:hypothetical protein
MKSLKRIIVTTTLLVTLASSLQAFQSSDWVKFAPAGGDFTVLVPAAPKELESAPVKDFTAHSFGVLAGHVVYVICYGDYAPSTHLNTDAELLANRDNFLKGLNGTAGTTTKIALDGRAGIEFTGESAEYTFESRVYISGNRVYQVAVGVKKGGPDNAANSALFLKSFAFVRTQDHSEP